MKVKVSAVGCGRTDAGVHASDYYFHINVNHDNVENIIGVFNNNLPDDIVVYDIKEIPRGFHAQYSAKNRTYTYYIHTLKNPFLSDVSSYYDLEDFDLDKVKKVLGLLKRYTDFKAFCLRPEKHKSTLCHVQDVSFKKRTDERGFVFTITADHFLRGMVRIIVGKLIETGKGKLNISDFKHHLSEGTPFRFLNQAYPQGLYLSKISYE